MKQKSIPVAMLEGLCGEREMASLLRLGLTNGYWRGARWLDVHPEDSLTIGDLSGAVQAWQGAHGTLELTGVDDEEWIVLLLPLLDCCWEQRAVLKALEALCWSVDLESGVFLTVTTGIERVLGFHPDDVIGSLLPSSWLVHLRSAPRGRMVVQMHTQDGRPVWLETEWWSDRQHCRATLVSRDISDRFRAKAQAETLRELERSGMIGCWEFDLETQQLSWTEEVSRLHGLPPETQASMELSLGCFPEPSRKQLEGALERAARGGNSYQLELPMITVQGESRWVLASGWPVIEQGRVVRLRGTLKCITQRKLAELERERSRLRSVLDTIPDLVWLKCPEGRFLECNPRFETLLGAERADILGKTDYDFVPKELADFFRANDLAALNASEPRRNEEWVQFADGARVLLETIKKPLVENGQLVGVLGIGRDLTEQWGDRQQLRASQHRLRLFLEHAPAAVAMLDRDLRYLLVSRRFASDYGLEFDSLIGRGHYEVFPELPERWKEVHQRCLRGAVETSAEDSFRRNDGKTEWVRWEVRPWYEDGGQVGGIILFTEVITAAKEAQSALKFSEEQLRAAQRMEAVGRLAGGVAHDFNNILTVIVSYAELARQDLCVEHPLYQDIGEILRASQRAEGLTRQLLTFSRRQVTSPEVLDLNSVVAGLSKMLHRLIGEDIDLQFCPHQAGPCWVLADRGQMEQVVMNLAVNARDAMVGGGRLEISTGLITLSAAQAARNGSIPGPHGFLCVRDNGCGMDEATREKIFEPFFTTKGLGKGTGLGLATVYGIVAQSQGAIQVESEPGKGTEMTIFLPSQPEPRLHQETQQHASEARFERKCILVVEDEANLRNVLDRVLKRAGFEVVLAGEAEEALQKAREQGERFDLILSDIIMPGMNGCELMAQLRPFCPRAQQLFMSGYTDDVLERFPIPRERMLVKPFDRQVLTATICKLLLVSETARVS